jgi:molybdenum ABC transporter molybdate-binding protein
MVSEALADLLAAIAQTSSISAAARRIGISYRHAWKLVDEGNKAAGEPLVLAAVGGVNGGGASLTLRGTTSLEVFKQLRGNLRETAAGLLHSAFGKSTEGMGEATIHLAAAISLQEVVGQLLTEYALRKPTMRVRAIYGASNELADHVLSGASCDIFLSADSSHLERLAAAKRISGGFRAVAMNSLAVIGPRSNAAINSVRDLPSTKQLVVADPASPLGNCTKVYLQRMGVYESVAQKAIVVDNSRAIMAAIRSGRADAGIAFASDAEKAADCQVLFAIEPSAAKVTYSAAICNGQRQKETLALLEFIRSAPAERCFRRCGFTMPTRRRK